MRRVIIIGGGAVLAAIEQRHALRFRPRRSLTIKLTLGADAEALGLLAWLARNQGRETIIPLPHLARRVTADAARLATSLFIDERDTLFLNALQPIYSGQTTFSSTLYGPGFAFRSGEALIVDPVNGWQRARVASGAGANELNLAEPLARPVAAGSRLYPALAGTIKQSTRLDHHAARVVDVVLDIEVAPPAWDYAKDGGFVPPDELFDCATPGNDWGSAHAIGFDAGLEQFDTVAAPVWTHRISERTPQTLARRVVASGATEIMALRGWVDWLRGRQKSVWIDEQVAGIDLAAAAPPGTDRLIVRRAGLPQWLGTDTMLLIRRAGQPVLRVRAAAVSSRDAATAELLLAEPLDVAAALDPADASLRITRALRCRLDHDAVDLIWHTPELLEVNFTFRALPENTEIGILASY